VTRPEQLPPSVESDLGQRVTDYIAGMTDRFATRLFSELSVPDGFVA
jgi:dGTPase